MADPTIPAAALTATATAAVTAADSRQRIDAEHRHLNALLEELVSERDPQRLESLLGALRAQLVAHFATEEAPEGLHEIVSQNAAHRLPNVQQLFAEHREILQRLDALRETTAALRRGPFQQLVDAVAALAAALAAHEAVEDEIFGEAFYTDIGGRA